MLLSDYKPVKIKCNVSEHWNTGDCSEKKDHSDDEVSR